MNTRQQREEQWAQYFVENGVSSTLILNETFSSLIRRGVADFCRGNTSTSTRTKREQQLQLKIYYIH